MAINAPVAELAEQYRRALLKRDIAAATALLQAYGRAWNRLNTLQEALVAELAAKRLAGTEITAGLVRRSERYQALMTQLQDELRRLLPYTEETIRAGQAGLIESALDETAALAQAGLPGTPETRAALMTAWNRLPTDAAESLVGVLQDGSPLYQLLAQLGEPTVQGIGEALVNGIVLGWNPKRIAGELRDVFGLTTTRALRIARTEMLRSYRTASIMSYQANPQIVKGWQWSASKSLRTCFPAGTMITTESGPKPIETVTVGERVLTHAGLWRPVTERMAFDYAGKMMELGTGSGNRLVATADHPVLIRRQGNYYWMAAQFCQPGDELWRCVNGEVDQFAHDRVRFAVEGQVGQADNPISSLSQPGDLALVGIGAPMPVGAVNLKRSVDLGEVEVDRVTVDGGFLFKGYTEALEAQAHVAFRGGLSAEPPVAMNRAKLLVGHRWHDTKLFATRFAGVDLRRAAAGFRAMSSAVVSLAKGLTASLTSYVLGLTVTRFAAIDLILLPQGCERLTASRANLVDPYSQAAAGPRAVNLFFAPLADVKRLAASRADFVDPDLAAGGGDSLIGEPAAGRAEFAPAFGMAGRLIKDLPTLDASHGDLALEMNGLRFHGDIITYVNHNKQTITVFNIEVAEDHSYVADGFVVHNCIACLWNDGKVFTAQEFFPAHVNCRCSPVPVTVSWRELGVDIPEQERPPTGQEWFLGLEPGQQEEILGGAVFRAWQAGKITPEQFWHTDHDETWGDAYVASSLKHVLGEGAQEFYQ
jgi:hypothetical protein